MEPGVGTIQAAVDAASAGATLVLADGTYTSSANPVLAIGSSITIRAQNAGQAVLDGEGARRVVTITSGTVVLDGLRITGGSTDHSSPGAGVAISGASTVVTFNACAIDNNQAMSSTCYRSQLASVGYVCGQAGGVYVATGTVSFIGCAIHSNQARGEGGGVMTAIGSNAVLTFRFCNIYSNVVTERTCIQNNFGTTICRGGDGAGLFLISSTNEITSSSIYNNSGGTPGHTLGSAFGGAGVHAWGGITNITNSSIYSNWHSRSGAGIFIFGGTLTMTQSSVYSNEVPYYQGGGLFSHHGTVIVRHNTFENNQAGSGGCALHLETPGELEENIFVTGSTACPSGVLASISTSSVSMVCSLGKWESPPPIEILSGAVGDAITGCRYLCPASLFGNTSDLTSAECSGVREPDSNHSHTMNNCLLSGARPRPRLADVPHGPLLPCRDGRSLPVSNGDLSRCHGRRQL